MKVKVCGLKYPENIKAVAALSPDYMGFIFYAPSPRFVEDIPAEVLSAIPSGTKKTAVFVNEDRDSISHLVDKYNFEAIQLHGNESPEFCALFKGKVTVLKAFGLDADFDFDQLPAYAGKVDFFLFDAKTDIHGGAGMPFDWSLLNRYKMDVPFFLSGGLSPANIAGVAAIEHPQFYGVDLNSKFETAPGVKDISRLEKAFDIIPGRRREKTLHR